MYLCFVFLVEFVAFLGHLTISRIFLLDEVFAGRSKTTDPPLIVSHTSTPEQAFIRCGAVDRCSALSA